MKALFHDKELYIKEIPEPTMENHDDIKIKIYMAGICGTDLAIINEKSTLKNILGHEAIGEVVAIGRNVTTVTIGDWVVINPNEHCGICNHCRQGLHYLCSGSDDGLAIAGLNKPGTFSDYFITKESFIEKIAPAIPAEKRELFLLVEPLACVLQGIEKLDCSELKKILVIGQGTMGYLATKILLKQGHQVYSVDSNEEKIKMLAKTVPRCFSSLNTIEDTFDIVIDAVGNQLAAGYPFLKANGEFLILGLQKDYEPNVNISTLVLNNQKIIGSSEYTTHFHTAKKYLEEFIDIQEDLFSKYELKDFDKAFFEKNNKIKRVLIMNE